MSVELKEVKRRISSTRQVQQVTSALQRVASAKLVKDKHNCLLMQDYLDNLRHVFRELTIAAPYAEHRFAAAAPTGDTVMIVFGSDRGLCGGMNANLQEKAIQFRQTAGDEKLHMIVIGKAASRRMRHAGFHVAQSVEHIPTTRSPGHGRPAWTKTALEIANSVTTSFLTGKCVKVYLLYNKFISGLHQIPTIELLLPFSVTAASDTREQETASAGAFRAAEFEPDAQTILAGLIPELILHSIENALVNSIASEDAKRQEAMSRATENAGRIIDDLMLVYSRLRQDSITAEMLELVGGTASQ